MPVARAKDVEPAGSDAGSAKSFSKKKAVELQVFAANSLEKALPEVQELYTDQTGTTFADTQFKASGDLVEQMRASAAVDVLITASRVPWTTPRPPSSSTPTRVRTCSSTIS
ncbi:MAG: substrate-binding domain-containing protein [Collinsella aerofaciens]